MLVRVRGMAPLAATRYELERLRCNLCGEVFTAPAPEGVGAEKYDATAAAMVALLKYGCGLPFNRIEKLQRNLGIPLPAATQWELVARTRRRWSPRRIDELIRQAAQGEVLHNDDTTMKMLDLGTSRQAVRTAIRAETIRSAPACTPPGSSRHARGTRSRCSSPAPARRREPGGGARAACGRTAAAHPDVRCALAQHCRANSTPSSPTASRTRAGSSSMSRRTSPSSAATCSRPCARSTATTPWPASRQLSPEERLAFHQEHSGPLMRGLQWWLYEQLEQRKVEPNSTLGGAVKLHAQALGQAHPVPARARGPAGQQRLRASPQESHPPPQECSVLQDRRTAPTSATCS